ncbi:hypothetical protein D3C71_1755020 [compost metagenome]
MARACWFRVLRPSFDPITCSRLFIRPPSSPSPLSILVLALFMWVVASATASWKPSAERLGSRRAEMKSDMPLSTLSFTGLSSTKV